LPRESPLLPLEHGRPQPGARRSRRLPACCAFPAPGRFWRGDYVEKIYACLSASFSSRFRNAYGEDSLQLFRDRSPMKADSPTLRPGWTCLPISCLRPARAFSTRTRRFSPLHGPAASWTHALIPILGTDRRVPSAFSPGVLSLVAFVDIPGLIAQTNLSAKGLVRSTQHPSPALLPRFGPTASAAAIRELIESRAIPTGIHKRHRPRHADARSPSNQAVQSPRPPGTEEIPQSQTPPSEDEDSTVSITLHGQRREGWTRQNANRVILTRPNCEY